MSPSFHSFLCFNEDRGLPAQGCAEVKINLVLLSQNRERQSAEAKRWSKEDQADIDLNKRLDEEQKEQAEESARLTAEGNRLSKEVKAVAKEKQLLIKKQQAVKDGRMTLLQDQQRVNEGQALVAGQAGTGGSPPSGFHPGDSSGGPPVSLNLV
jgi:hypothetical protein